MLDLASQVASRANSAQSVRTFYRDGNSGLLQRLGRFQLRRHGDNLPGGGDLDLEIVVFPMTVLWNRKILAVQGVLGPAAGEGSVEHRVHERSRPTSVQMVPWPGRLQYSADVEPALIRKVAVDVFRPGHRGEFGNEGGLGTGPGLVVELEGPFLPPQGVSHGNQWCDPDAPCQQQVATRIAGDRKVIPRGRHDHRRARLQHLVDLERPATSPVFPQDAQQITRPVLRIAGQGELPDVLRRHRDIDVRSGFEAR